MRHKSSVKSVKKSVKKNKFKIKKKKCPSLAMFCHSFLPTWRASKWRVSKRSNRTLGLRVRARFKGRSRWWPRPVSRGTVASATQLARRRRLALKKKKSRRINCSRHRRVRKMSCEAKWKTKSRLKGAHTAETNRKHWKGKLPNVAWKQNGRCLLFRVRSCWRVDQYGTEIEEYTF